MLVAGMEINCLVEGDGPPLLFLHGWGVGFDAYRLLLNHLSERFTVYAPDLPGFGQSPPPDEVWDADRYARFVVSLCREHGIEPVVCMGHSNGGRILLKLLGCDEPPLSPGKLVLLDSAGIKPKRPPVYYVKVYSYKLAKAMLRPFPKARARYMARKGSDDYKAASPLMRAVMTKLLQEDMTPLLPSIRAETLLIWGKEDTATPLSDGQRMEQAIPGAGLAALPGGHWVCMEQLGRVKRILDSFL